MAGQKKDRPRLQYTRYRAQQVVKAEDLNRDIEYFRNKIRRMNRYFVGYGIVYGVDEEPYPSGRPEWEFKIQPGFLITPGGDEIQIEETVKLTFAHVLGKDWVYDNRWRDRWPSKNSSVKAGETWWLFARWLSLPNDVEMHEPDEEAEPAQIYYEDYAFILRKEDAAKYPDEAAYAKAFTNEVFIGTIVFEDKGLKFVKSDNRLDYNPPAKITEV